MRGGMNCTTVDPMAHWLTLQIPEPLRAAVMIEVGRLARRAQLESSDTIAKRTANGPKPIGSRQSTLPQRRKIQSTILRTERLYLYTFWQILEDRLGGSAGALTPTRNKKGNPSDVIYLHEYYVDNSWDSRSVWRNIEKIIPEAMAVLTGKCSMVERVKTRWNCVNGILQDGELIKPEDLQDPFGAKLLTAHEILRHILMQSKGRAS